MRVAQPVFAPAILAGYRAANAARDAQDATRDAAIVQVAAEIRSAYLQHAKARRLAELRAATRTLLEEQVRVMTRLIEARPRDARRALARARRVERGGPAAGGIGPARERLAQAFNMMLARALADTVLVDEDTLGFGPLPSLEDAIARGARERPELRAPGVRPSARRPRRVARCRRTISQSRGRARLRFQGNEYRFASDADYTSLSVVASWNLFNGGRDAARAEQAALDARRYAVQGDEARRGVELQVRLGLAGGCGGAGSDRDR